MTTKKTPALDEISAVDAAQRLGMTQQSIGMWCSRPGAPARKQGTRVFVQWPAFARWREGQLVEQGKKEVTGDADFEQHRTRKMAAEAGLAELELAKAQGEFVAVADYEKAIGVVLDHAMARLRAIPVRLSHLGQAVEASAETEVERIVLEMSGFDDDVVEIPTPPDL